MADPISKALHARALQRIPGGVNSPVRAFRAVGGEPVYIARGKGPYIWGADGTRYIDYVGSWGPMLLGHAHPAVIDAIQRAAADGTSFGAPTEREVEFAEALCAAIPSMEKVRLCSSGTEACMSALRLARGFTGRDKIVKFEGCYHGHADFLLVKAGSGAATFGVPDSAGVPAGAAQNTLTVAYNDLDAVRALFAAEGAQIAAIIVEPVVGNMGCVPPAPGARRLWPLPLSAGRPWSARWRRCGRGRSRGWRLAARGAPAGLAPAVSARLWPQRCSWCVAARILLCAHRLY